MGSLEAEPRGALCWGSTEGLFSKEPFRERGEQGRAGQGRGSGRGGAGAGVGAGPKTGQGRGRGGAVGGARRRVACRFPLSQPDPQNPRL